MSSPPTDSPESDETAGLASVEPNGGNPGGEPKPKRNDRISPLAVIVLVGYIISQSSLLSLLSSKLHSVRRFHLTSDTAPSEPSTTAIQHIFTIDFEAKSFYCLSPSDMQLVLGSSKKVKSASDYRTQALKDAESLLEQYPDQPAIARRVILLRAEIGKEYPLQTWTGMKGYRIYSPLDAFKLGTNVPAPTRKVYNSERDGYALLFGSASPLSQAQAAKVRADFAGGPDQKWWGDVAKHQIALRSGDQIAASHQLTIMQSDALRSVEGLAGLVISVLGIALAGVGMAIVMIILHYTRSTGDSWISDAIRPVLTNEQRRLGAGDLSNLFLIYLLSMIGISMLASVAVGSVQHSLLSLSWRYTVIVDIGATAVLEVVVGAITIASAFALAKRRGAKLSYEIGLNFGWESAWKTIVFGVLSWGAALALIYPMEYFTTAVFHDAPAPVNPVIPLMMSTPAGFAAVLMYILAAVLAPILEEIVFRGFVMNALNIKYGAPRGIFFTGLAFGMMHPVGIAEQVVLVTLGCALAWIANRKQSLLPSMIAHSLQNTYSYCLILVSIITVHAPHGLSNIMPISI